MLARAASASVAVVLVTVLAWGCGGSAKSSPGTSTTASEQARLTALAHKCGESKTAVSRQIDAALKSLGKQERTPRARAELSVALEKVVSYVEKRDKTFDCKGLLGAIVLTSEEHNK
jgi:hypothetical protein